MLFSHLYVTLVSPR